MIILGGTLTPICSPHHQYAIVKNERLKYASIIAKWYTRIIRNLVTFLRAVETLTIRMVIIDKLCTVTSQGHVVGPSLYVSIYLYTQPSVHPPARTSMIRLNFSTTLKSQPPYTRHYAFHESIAINQGLTRRQL